MAFATLLAPEVNGGVGVAFTDRWGGVSEPPYDTWNFGIGKDSSEHVSANFALLAQATGCGQVAIAAQCHGIDVARVGEGFSFFGKDSLDLAHAPTVVADALVSVSTDVALAMRVADCVPVVLADKGKRVIAVAHAGRVGLLAGVLQATLEAMRREGAKQITAWVGPHIGPECYEVPLDMAQAAWEQLPATRGLSAAGTDAIDLGGGVCAVLEAEGVDVERVDPCTSCDPRFFSHRRDRGVTGRQVGVVWLGPSGSA
ncbi:MAG: polyphenol oxidase family protein [Propionibacteriaceae bacterium]|jgi:YfiH family protein|nr:polyphenol oxidase family protein [Propionibacteriaceae bacterium]